MAEPGDQPAAAAATLTAAGLLAAVVIGAWWTGAAIAAGDTAATVLRFALSLAAGWYYLVLYRVVRGRPALPGPR